MSIQEDIENFVNRRKRKKGITMKCISKEQYECIQLTKQNREEFLKIFEPNIDGEHIFIKEDNDKHCIVEHLGWHKTYYFYNQWYVLGLEDYTWSCYTDEEFKDMFELVK